jgi:hypothetical protein
MPHRSVAAAAAAAAPTAVTGRTPPEGTILSADPAAPIAMIGTVSPRCERYCPILADHMDRMWPSHPPLFYALAAGRRAPYPRIIEAEASTWSAVLLTGLEQLRREGYTHAFVLLEDHVPLWPCDEALLADQLRMALDHDLRCLYFCKHEWPWSSTEHSYEPDGRIRGWAAIDVVTLEGYRLARMPRNDLHYNRCQPALWRIDDYVALLGDAVRKGVADPWTFETFAMPGQPEHYVSEYQWPSRRCGYRRLGRVDLRALYSMKMPEGKRLRDELLRERFPALSDRARAATGALFWHWGRLLRIPQRFERRQRMVHRPR